MQVLWLGLICLPQGSHANTRVERAHTHTLKGKCTQANMYILSRYAKLKGGSSWLLYLTKFNAVYDKLSKLQVFVSSLFTSVCASVCVCVVGVEKIRPIFLLLN